MHPAGVEPATSGFVVRRPIQLGHGCMKGLIRGPRNDEAPGPSLAGGFFGVTLWVYSVVPPGAVAGLCGFIVPCAHTVPATICSSRVASMARLRVTFTALLTSREPSRRNLQVLKKSATRWSFKWRRAEELHPYAFTYPGFRVRSPTTWRRPPKALLSGGRVRTRTGYSRSSGGR